MSGSAVKANAREIRRAFGPQAVDRIEQLNRGLVHHAGVLQRHTDELETQAGALRVLKKSATDAGFAYNGMRDCVDNPSDRMMAADVEILQRVSGQSEAILRRNFMGRLRWLFTGR